MKGGKKEAVAEEQVSADFAFQIATTQKLKKVKCFQRKVC